jgi:hypothetical protein
MGFSCVWDTERGFGERSWRYSAVINNGVVEKLFIEVRKLDSASKSVWKDDLIYVDAVYLRYTGWCGDPELRTRSLPCHRCRHDGHLSAEQEVKINIT